MQRAGQWADGGAGALPRVRELEEIETSATSAIGGLGLAVAVIDRVSAVFGTGMDAILKATLAQDMAGEPKGHPIKLLNWASKCVLLELAVLDKLTEDFDSPVSGFNPVTLWLNYDQVRRALLQVTQSNVIKTLTVS